MKHRYPGLILVLLLLPGIIVWTPSESIAQIAQPETVDAGPKSAVRAAALSMILPGLGQRYVNGGSWRTTGTVFALADVASWVALLRTSSLRDRRIDSYESLAAARADAIIDGKDRRFFLNLATFKSSDEYLEVQLRNRAWDQLDYVSTREFQWEWMTDADFFRFRDLRDDAESLDRRSSILVATLVANRLLSAVIAVRSAGKRGMEPRAALTLHPPLRGSLVPGIEIRARL